MTVCCPTRTTWAPGSDDGVFVLHSSGRSDGPGITNPWLAKYTFPGGCIPALSEVLPAIERAGFLVTDIEILRLHYADTLKQWRKRFLAKRSEASRLYDERFCRMWELYLVSSEMAFREEGMMVFQIQMTKTQGVVPNTRNYIPEGEARLRDVKVSRAVLSNQRSECIVASLGGTWGREHIDANLSI